MFTGVPYFVEKERTKRKREHESQRTFESLGPPPSSAWTKPINSLPAHYLEIENPDKFKLPLFENPDALHYNEDFKMGEIKVNLVDSVRIKEGIKIENLELWRGPRGGVYLKDPVTGRKARAPWLHLWMRDSGGKGNARNHISYKYLSEEEREKYKEIRPVHQEAVVNYMREPEKFPLRHAAKEREAVSTARGKYWKDNPQAQREEKAEIMNRNRGFIGWIREELGF